MSAKLLTFRLSGPAAESFHTNLVPLEQHFSVSLQRNYWNLNVHVASRICTAKSLRFITVCIIIVRYESIWQDTYTYHHCTTMPVQSESLQWLSYLVLDAGTSEELSHAWSFKCKADQRGIALRLRRGRCAALATYTNQRAFFCHVMLAHPTQKAGSIDAPQDAGEAVPPTCSVQHQIKALTTCE